MSGGHFKYENYKVNEWADIVREDIKQELVEPEWKNSYTEEQLKYMKNFHKLLIETAKLLSSYDYAMSGDTDLDDFIEDYKKYKEGIK